MTFFSELLAVGRAALVAVINTAIGTVGEDSILEIAWTVFRRATQKAILTTISVIFRTIVCAMIGYIGPVDSIWKSIIDNPANQELFETLRRDWWKAARFLVDLMEPMKRFVSAESTDGVPSAAAAAWNPYNELDLSQPMNRHAVMSQVQRFFKSIIEVFRQADLDVGRFDMNTRLETDSGKSLINTVALQRPNAMEDSPAGESWIFVNGIAGEFYWNHLSVQKLQDYFFRPTRRHHRRSQVPPHHHHRSLQPQRRRHLGPDRMRRRASPPRHHQQRERSPRLPHLQTNPLLPHRQLPRSPRPALPDLEGSPLRLQDLQA
jgi:hypothetical protein